LGFSLKILGSESYVLGKLEKLGPGKIAELKAVFAQNHHPRLAKEMGSKVPYGPKAEYLKNLEKADPTKVARLIRVVGILLQTKSYLFWRRPVGTRSIT